MADNALGIAAPEGRPSSGRFDPSENAVQRTRAWTGLLVVIAGDALIGGAAAFGVFKGGDATSAQSVAILSSAFTAISTMTAAYFGIRAVTNTAQSAVAQQAATTMATAASAAAGPTGGGPGGPGGPGAPSPDGPTGLGTAVAMEPGTAVAVEPGTAVAVEPGTAVAQEPGTAAAQEPGTAVAVEPAGAGTAADAEPAAAGPKPDRPVDEPDDATQDDQYALINETGNDRQDMTEEEEASLLEGEFGPADHHGIYGAPKGDESQ
jgi:hypothetical protein